MKGFKLRKWLYPISISQTILIVLPLPDMRSQLAQIGIKVTYNDFIVRACAIGLRKHPAINSGYNMSTENIIRFKTVDIAVAVDVAEGLITPIICHADYKNISEISRETKSLIKKAKENSLKPEEYQGGSFYHSQTWVCLALAHSYPLLIHLKRLYSLSGEY